MTFAAGPFTVTAGTAQAIRLPQDAPTLRQVVLSNYSPYLLTVTLGGLQQLQNPWTAQLFAIPASASGIQIDPQLAGLPSTVPYYGYVAATFYSATDADQAALTGVYPVALAPTLIPAVTAPTSIATAVGVLNAGTASFNTTAPLGPTSQLIGLTGGFSWSGGVGGPFSRAVSITLAGNISGSDSVTVPVSYVAAAPGGVFQVDYTLPLSVPLSFAALLGVSTNTVLTITVAVVAPPLPIGDISAAVNAVIA